MKRRQILFVLMIAAFAVIVLLIGSLIGTSSQFREMREAARMQSFAAIVTGQLQAYRKTHGGFPRSLGELTWTDRDLPPSLGLSTNDLTGFHYESNGGSFQLAWESEHFRFAFGSSDDGSSTDEPLHRN